MVNRKMKIIEFCGAPGCGKSALCDKVEKMLKDKNYITKNLQKTKNLEKPPVIRKFLKVFDCLRYWFFRGNYNLKKELFFRKHTYDLSISKRWAFRILEANYRIYDAKKNGVEFALFDEGCVQFITSLFGQFKADEDILNLLKECIYMSNDTILLNCKVDFTTNIERIKKRNKINDRFLANSDIEMLEKLNKKTESINCVLSSLDLDVFEIDTLNMKTAIAECDKYIKKWMD